MDKERDERWSPNEKRSGKTVFLFMEEGENSIACPLKIKQEKRYFYLWKKGEMSAAHHKMEPGNNVFLIVE